MNILPDYTEIDRLRADIDRLRKEAEDARLFHERENQAEEVKRLKAELAEVNLIEDFWREKQ